jgi:hypothetical protein
MIMCDSAWMGTLGPADAKLRSNRLTSIDINIPINFGVQMQWERTVCANQLKMGAYSVCKSIENQRVRSASRILATSMNCL